LEHAELLAEMAAATVLLLVTAAAFKFAA